MKSKSSKKPNKKLKNQTVKKEEQLSTMYKTFFKENPGMVEGDESSLEQPSPNIIVDNFTTYGVNEESLLVHNN